VDEAKTHAWIFLSVPEQPAPLSDITLMADAIIHAVPTQSEFQQSFRWLQQHGLISRVGKRYSLTPAGIALRESMSSSKILDTWENVFQHFSRDDRNI